MLSQEERKELVRTHGAFGAAILEEQMLQEELNTALATIARVRALFDVDPVRFVTPDNLRNALDPKGD